MIYIGLDVAKKGSVYCAQDANGTAISAGKLAHTPEGVSQLLSLTDSGACVALEATGNWQHVAGLFQSCGAQVVLSHPRRTRAIASAKVKTDAIDAQTLCDLLRVGLLPEAYMPPVETQALRRLVRTRTSLVESRTRVKNQVHSVLTQAGLIPSATDLFGRMGRSWLSSQQLTAEDQLVVKVLLEQIEHINASVKELERELQRQLSSQAEFQALCGLPGFGLITSAVFIAEVGDVRRFKRARHLLSYLGIVPRVRASGGKTRFGSLTKEGPPLVRNMLVQAAYPAIRKDAELRELYERIKERHGSQVARINVARKLATRAFHRLKQAYSLHPDG